MTADKGKGPALVRTAATAVRVVRFVNTGLGLALVAGLLASLVWGEGLTAAMLGPGADLAERTAGMRWVMAMGLATAGIAWVLLKTLGQIIATVGAGDPFVDANAGRLMRIGCALLALQLLDLGAIAIVHAFPALGQAAPAADISVAGWLAVLLAFVLARVFAAGAAMRDDLAGLI